MIGDGMDRDFDGVTVFGEPLTVVTVEFGDIRIVAKGDSHNTAAQPKQDPVPLGTDGRPNSYLNHRQGSWSGNA